MSRDLAKVLYETHQLALRIAEILEAAGLARAGARTRVGAAYLKDAIQALAEQAGSTAKLQEGPAKPHRRPEVVRIVSDLPDRLGW
jgi:hypothetical protein